MIPNARGNTPPAAPCRTLGTIITLIVGANAAATQPATSSIRVMTSKRPLPYESPSRPMMGVVTDDEIKKAVIIHDAPAWVESSSCWMRGSAVAAVDWTMQ